MVYERINDIRTPCLPLPRKRSPDGASTECGGEHLIAAHYSFIDPREWKAVLAWLADFQRTAYPHKWSPISYRSSARRRKNAGQRLTFYRWATRTNQEEVVTELKGQKVAHSDCFYILKLFLLNPTSRPRLLYKAMACGPCSDKRTCITCAVCEAANRPQTLCYLYTARVMLSANSRHMRCP